MKIYSIVFLLILQSVSTFAQAPKKKIIGGMAENDSIWKIDVEMEVAAFVDLRLFLAEFQSENKATFLTKLDAGTVRKITELDSLYQNEVLLFRDWFTRKSITKRRKKQAYSYLDMMIQMDKFFCYPDVYAMILNPLRFQIIPKIDKGVRSKIFSLIEQITSEVKKLNDQEQLEIVKIRENFKKKYPKSPHTLNQDGGALSDEVRQKYELINLLILLNRE